MRAPKLQRDWLQVLRNAWSVRLQLAETVIGAIATVLVSGQSRWICAAYVLLRVLNVFVRVLDQKDFPRG